MFMEISMSIYVSCSKNFFFGHHWRNIKMPPTVPQIVTEMLNLNWVDLVTVIKIIFLQWQVGIDLLIVTCLSSFASSGNKCCLGISHKK